MDSSQVHLSHDQAAALFSDLYRNNSLIPLLNDFNSLLPPEPLLNSRLDLRLPTHAPLPPARNEDRFRLPFPSTTAEMIFGSSERVGNKQLVQIDLAERWLRRREGPKGRGGRDERVVREEGGVIGEAVVSVDGGSGSSAHVRELPSIHKLYQLRQRKRGKRAEQKEGGQTLFASARLPSL
jgi:hypothetical protein